MYHLPVWVSFLLMVSHVASARMRNAQTRHLVPVLNIANAPGGRMFTYPKLCTNPYVQATCFFVSEAVRPGESSDEAVMRAVFRNPGTTQVGIEDFANYDIKPVDNRISLQEFIGLEGRLRGISVAFAGGDANGDGFISLPEFEAGIENGRIVQETV